MACVAAWLLSVVTDGTRVTVPSGPGSGLTLGGSLRPHLPEPPPAQVGECLENLTCYIVYAGQVRIIIVIIWPESKLVNRWIQFVVNFSQTIYFSNEPVQEHISFTFAALISIFISSSRNIIFNYLLHLKITHAPIC